jgi:hypothetical protein
MSLALNKLSLLDSTWNVETDRSSCYVSTLQLLMPSQYRVNCAPIYDTLNVDGQVGLAAQRRVY